jgi:MFS family permease
MYRGAMDDEPRALARERAAVAALFLVTGATFGTLAARVPGVQDRIALSEGDLGIAFAGLMVGAFAGLPLAAPLAARFGSRRLLVGSLAVFVPLLAAIPLAPDLVAVTAILTAFGAANSAVDVAINAQGAHVERGYGRPILSGLHAMHSLGALAAAGLAALVAAGDVSVARHFAAVAAVLTPLGLAAISRLTDEPRDPNRAPRLALPTRALAVPALIAFCMVFGEDVANTWSAVYLRTVVETGPGLAAAAFAVYAAGVLAGRTIADYFVAARGPSFTVRAGGAIATGGMALAVAVPKPAPALVGLFLFGLGFAPVFPVLYSVVAHRDPPSAGASIAAVTTVGYLGSVVGPSSVGGLAESFGLRAALLTVLAFALAVAALAGRLPAAPIRERRAPR